MKLLLTSQGITNNSLKQALYDLVGSEKISTVFITNASNNFNHDKKWLIDVLVGFRNLGEIDLLDLISTPKEIWKEKFENCNVIAFGGGDVAVMDVILQTNFDKDLKELLKTKVYVGHSAESQIMCPKIWASSTYLYTHSSDESPKGLNYVNFYFRPHYNSPKHLKCRKEILEKIAQKYPNEKIYACDDNSGIKIINDKIEIISEGEVLELN